MTFQDLVPVLIVASFVAMLVIERLFPAREQPHVRGWMAKGLAFFVVVFALNGAIPALVLGALGDYTLLHLASLGTLGGALLMLLVTDLMGYLIHRGLHNSEPIWRWTHQLHHSAERMDMLGAAYFHPFDFLLQQIVPTIAVVVLLGVTPMAAAVGGLAGFLVGVFPHLNVRHARVVRLRPAATRDARGPSPARRPRLQLRRAGLQRSAVRHVAQPSAFSRERVRLLGRRLVSRRCDAARPGRDARCKRGPGHSARVGSPRREARDTPH